MPRLRPIHTSASRGARRRRSHVTVRTIRAPEVGMSPATPPSPARSSASPRCCPRCGGRSRTIGPCSPTGSPRSAPPRARPPPTCSTCCARTGPTPPTPRCGPRHYQAHRRERGLGPANVRAAADRAELQRYPWIRDLARLGALLDLPPWREPASLRENVEEYRQRLADIVDTPGGSACARPRPCAGWSYAAAARGHEPRRSPASAAASRSRSRWRCAAPPRP